MDLAPWSDDRNQESRIGIMKNKEKYSLDKLRISVTHAIVGITDIKIYHGINCVYHKSYSVEEFTLRWITDFMKWLEEECVLKILTDKEKAYLSAVIKPFREEVESIKKIDIEEDEQLQLQIPNGLVIMDFPLFKKGAMYRGMEEGREYTLEELGL